MCLVILSKSKKHTQGHTPFYLALHLGHGVDANFLVPVRDSRGSVTPVRVAWLLWIFWRWVPAMLYCYAQPCSIAAAKTGRISPSSSSFFGAPATGGRANHPSYGTTLPQWHRYETLHKCHPKNVCSGCCYRRRTWNGHRYCLYVRGLS